MKKCFFVTFLIVISINVLKSQNAYYDALALRNIPFIPSTSAWPDDNATKKTVADILANYCDRDRIKQVFFVQNEFLRSYGMNFANLSGAAFSGSKNNDFEFSSLGNLNVTTIADGFAKFIVERTKSELQAAFFDRFIEEISKPEYEDIRTLFPTTYIVVKQLPTEVYSYEKYLQSLRNAFGKDMETILPHLEIVLRNGRFRAFFNNHPELKSICFTGLYFGKELQKGTHIGSALEKYNPASADYTLADINANTIRENAFRFIQEVSKSFRTANGNVKEYWVPADSIMMLINDKDAFNIYLGLLYQKVSGLDICNTNGCIKYSDAMSRIAGGIGTLKNFIENIAAEISNAQEQLKALEEKIKSERSIDDYVTYFNSAIRVIESFKNNELVQDIVALIPGAVNEINTNWERFSNVIEGANAVLSVYTSIKEKNYSLAIAGVKTLYEMRYKPDSMTIDSIKTNVEKVIAFLLDKGAFIASVAEAKSSQEVYEAINKAAMPVGSARVKRMAVRNFAVNAYCGLFIGNEVIQSVDKTNGFKNFNSFGLTAPVGITFSKGGRILPWPLSEIFKAKGFSTSWFLSIIDLGAVAAFRFQDNTTAQVPTIELKNIFSPGLFWSVGFPKVPLSANIGAQVGPNLRKVNSTVNDYSDKTYIRYSISLCIDIPVFNLHTKSK